MAYVVYTINNSVGTPVERRLVCYPSIADMANAVTLIRDVAPSPLEIGPNTNAVIQPFNRPLS